MPDQTDWGVVFDGVFRDLADSVQARVWGEVLGEEYPAEVDPYSYLSWTELWRFVDELRVGAGGRLGDVGCGLGGPGLWMAAQTGADLVGVDVSEVALAGARDRAAALGLAGRSQFRLGSFDANDLPDGWLDAVMSVEALTFAVDKAAAVRGLARVLRPGGRLVVTTCDYHDQPKGRPPQVDDHRPLLAEAGLAVLAYEETVDWRYRAEAIAEKLLAAVPEIAAQTGEDVDQLREETQEMRAAVDAMSRRVLVVAERTGPS